MFNITLEINGEKFKKSAPTLNDYRLLLEYNNRNSGKTFLTDATPVVEAVDLIVEFFGNKFSAEDVEKNVDLQGIMNCFRQIESNVTEVFTGAPLNKALKILKEQQTR